METVEAVRLWIDAWTRGWTTHDPDLIAARYSPNCTMVSSPFRAPHDGREGARSYAADCFECEESAEVSFGGPIVEEDRAAVTYDASVTGIDGSSYKIAGVSLLRFDKNGLVAEHRDYWVMAPPGGR